MTGWVALLTLTVAVSMDSFGVGVTYGVRGMKITFFSILLIAICSAMMLLAAMNLGTIISTFLSPSIAEKIGGILLIGLGIYVLWQFFKKRDDRPDKGSDSPYIWNMEIRSLGIVIQILRTPHAADIDRSGTIVGLEALLLGLALSLDSFAAGLGASLLGFPHLQTALFVSTMSAFFLVSGMKLGKLLSNLPTMRFFSFLPGIMLIVLGFFKL
ncbi:sporulation membrane protein YtaF [Pseudalkalibacillus berkeleyi]|uniref:Sporulation membrane protein YtaF n=1 Tax=Pseudalkalibacillus berkeleyi TaxID=1069813 RepID=A0ABS9H2A8_9BACL|nr:sporulation membrane protein YtaF [Pseudalkalibacillus berkeleyi]MCF6138191.1 sporulation membrane protein YtaF [Pseudalkalibacillus berkeleyi]